MVFVATVLLGVDLGLGVGVGFSLLLIIFRTILCVASRTILCVSIGSSGTILCGLVEPYCAFIARELYCALVVGEYMKGLVEKGNKCFNNLKRSKIKNIFLIAQQGI